VLEAMKYRISEDLAISIGRDKSVVFKTDLSVGFWLPILSRAVVKVVGTSDYNIVQNNGKCKSIHAR
jgi:hypothetical protein